MDEIRYEEMTDEQKKILLLIQIDYVWRVLRNSDFLLPGEIRDAIEAVFDAETRQETRNAAGRLEKLIQSQEPPSL